MIWPFRSKTENRNFFDGVEAEDKTEVIENLPLGNTPVWKNYRQKPSPKGLSTIEIGAGIVSRLLSTAEVQGLPLLNSVLADIGRHLVRDGELVIVPQDGILRVITFPFYLVQGTGSNPRDWDYQLQISNPSGTKTEYRKGRDLWHFRVNPDPISPWRGVASWKSAEISSTLLSQIQQSLTDTAEIPSFQLIRWKGWSSTSANKSIASNSIMPLLSRNARLLVEYFKAKEETEKPEQIRPDPSPTLVDVMNQVEDSLLLAIGISPAFRNGQATGQTLREVYRQMLYSTIKPMAKVVKYELALKGHDVEFDFTEAMASDLNQKTRSLKNLIDAGIPLDQARRLTGLD